MIRSPVEAFAELRDALMRMHALDAAMASEAVCADVGDHLEHWDKQADRALIAWADLEQSDALGEIEALLSATCGGET